MLLFGPSWPQETSAPAPPTESVCGESWVDVQTRSHRFLISLLFFTEWLHDTCVTLLKGVPLWCCSVAPVWDLWIQGGLSLYISICMSDTMCVIVNAAFDFIPSPICLTLLPGASHPAVLCLILYYCLSAAVSQHHNKLDFSPIQLLIHFYLHPPRRSIEQSPHWSAGLLNLVGSIIQ